MSKYTLVCSECSDKAAEPVQHGDACVCGGRYEEAIVFLPRTITSDHHPSMAQGEVSYALAGNQKAYMNVNGAVSVLDQNGEHLGVMPNEMSWVQGMPDGWCGQSKF